MKKAIFAIALIFVLTGLFGQDIVRFKETKNIYLLDVTLSMWGQAAGSENIFNDVRNELINAINAINNERTEIVVVTFQDEILDTWSYFATQKGKNKLINKLNNIDPAKLSSSYTNILAAWEKGRELINPNKINVIFLLTDGQHTTSKPTRQDLYNEVRSWGNFARNRDYYAFLVELVVQATDANLREVVEQTANAQIISGIEFFVIAVEDAHPVVNINDNLSFTLNLVGDRIDNIPDNFTFSLELDDINFKLQKTKFELDKKPFQIKLLPQKTIDELKHQLPQESTLNANITYDINKYPQVKLLNHLISIKIKNRYEMVLEIEVLE